MFFKLFKKKDKKLEDKFTLAELRKDGQVFLLRFKQDQQKVRDSGKYPYQIEITIPFHSSTKGMPTKEENEQLINTEILIENDLSKEDIAIFVGVITGGGVKKFIFYTGEPQRAEEILEQLKEEVKHHKLTYTIRKDSNWEGYKMFSPPSQN